MGNSKSLFGVGLLYPQAVQLDSFALDLDNVETVLATGSVQADATELSPTKFWAVVSNGDGIKGLRFPNTTKIGQVRVLQKVSNSVKLYPATGGSVNGAATDAALVTRNGTCTLYCICVAANTWRCG